MAHKKASWLKMGMNLWIHETKFKVIDCNNPRNCVLETDAGIRSSLDVAGLFLSGHIKLTNAEHDDTPRIAEQAVSTAQLERANTIAKDFDNLPNEYGKLGPEMISLAKKYDVSLSTLARWKGNYLTKGISGLFHKHNKKGGRGQKRLDPKVEAMIKTSIETHFLSRIPKSMDETIRLIRSYFAAEGLVPPSVWVIHNRIKSLSENTVLRAQKGSSFTKDLQHVSQDEHKVFRPLQEVQIDHSPIDIQLLSTKWRRNIGKAQVTLVEDINTRVILGLYIGLEHPSFLSVSYALRESIFPKDNILSRYGLSSDKWPTYGLMEMIHTDNAAEFDSQQMDHFCMVNRVEKQFRPIGRKEFGGHVESGIKLVMKYIHTLPGTTFSNPTKRGDYDSEGKAQIDLNELRKLVYLRVINIENHRKRDELGGLSPIEMWQKAIDEGWTPRMPADYDQFKYSLLPYKKRQITRHGISISALKYSGPCLRHWRALEKPRKKELYQVYYDPLDMRKASFVHPDGSGMSPLTLISLTSEHPISLEEIKAAKQKSARYPAASPDLHLAHKQEQEILEEASKKNKNARKLLEKRADTKSRLNYDTPGESEEDITNLNYSYLPDWAKDLKDA